MILTLVAYVEVLVNRCRVTLQEVLYQFSIVKVSPHQILHKKLPKQLTEDQKPSRVFIAKENLGHFNHSENKFLNCVVTGDEMWVHYAESETKVQPASVAQLDAPSDWRPGGRGFNPRRGRQHSFVEIDHEIFSMVILSLPLIQEGQLSVSGERMCTILVNRLED